MRLYSQQSYKRDLNGWLSKGQKFSDKAENPNLYIACKLEFEYSSEDNVTNTYIVIQ